MHMKLLYLLVFGLGIAPLAHAAPCDAMLKQMKDDGIMKDDGKAERLWPLKAGSKKETGAKGNRFADFKMAAKGKEYDVRVQTASESAEKPPVDSALLESSGKLAATPDEFLKNYQNFNVLVYIDKGCNLAIMKIRKK